VSKRDDVATCDECARTATFVCGCARCEREPTLQEKFHACEAHKAEVARSHRRIRGEAYTPDWFLVY
jgi:hypothetical protein